MALASGVLMALLVAFFYLVPAAFLHLLVRGLSDARKERWEIPEVALPLKRAYRTGAIWGLAGNRLLLGVTLVHLLALVVLAGHDCAAQRSHLSAAASNLLVFTEGAFVVVLVAMAAAGLAGIGFAVMYNLRARKEGWADPRRRDLLVVHILLVPFSLMLMWVAFGVARATVCPAFT